MGTGTFFAILSLSLSLSLSNPTNSPNPPPLSYAFEVLALLSASTILITMCVHSNVDDVFVRLKINAPDRTDTADADGARTKAIASVDPRAETEPRAGAGAIAPLTNEDRRFGVGMCLRLCWYVCVCWDRQKKRAAL